MKKYRGLFLVSALTAITLSCKKEQIVPLPITSTDGKANIKIVHASAYTTNTSVQLKVNDTRVSSALSYSTPFPGGGLNTGGSNMPYYLSIDPGNTKISMSFPKAGTNIDSVALYSTTADLAANKYYTQFIFDTLAKTQSLLLEDNVSVIAPGKSRYRFVHLMTNVPAVDLYANADKIATNVAFKAVSPEFTMNLKDTVRFAIRPTGAAPTTAPLAIYPAANAGALVVPDRRNFTIYSRGYSGATGNRAPAISLLFNHAVVE